MVRPFGLLLGLSFVLCGTAGCQRDPVLEGKRLSEWASQLRSGESSARLAAVRAISKAEWDRGVPVLIEALRGADEEIRKEAISVISKVGAPATQSLLNALSDVEIRAEAIKALRAIGPPAKAAAAPLLGILRSQPREPSLRVVEEDPYKALLSRRDDRQSAAEALLTIDPANPETPPILCSLVKEFWPIQMLKTMGDNAIPALSQSLKHNDADIQAKCILALAEHRGPKAMSALREGLGSDDAVVRGRAAIALAEAGQRDEPIVSALRRARDTRMWSRRCFAPAPALTPGQPKARQPWILRLQMAKPESRNC